MMIVVIEYFINCHKIEIKPKLMFLMFINVTEQTETCNQRETFSPLLNRASPSLSAHLMRML